MTYHLIGHPLCPYVQRVAITLLEKNLDYISSTIDLAQKPAWFLAVSPTGKTPVLLVGQEALFESAVICEYLEQVHAPAMLASAALARAKQRAWIEYASTCLQKIAGFYQASQAQFATKQNELRLAFENLETRLECQPYFSGATFTLVDAAFAPVFRYLPVFREIGGTDFSAGLIRLQAWQQALRARHSVQNAVAADYPRQLFDFLRARQSHLGSIARAHLLSELAAETALSV